MSTNTITVLEPLRAGDEVYVATSIEGSGYYYTESGLHSSNGKEVYFTGQKIAD